MEDENFSEEDKHKPEPLTDKKPVANEVLIDKEPAKPPRDKDSEPTTSPHKVHPETEKSQESAAESCSKTTLGSEGK